MHMCACTQYDLIVSRNVSRYYAPHIPCVGAGSVLAA